MEDRIRQKADLMADNYRVLKKNFKWESAQLNHFGAMVHTTKGIGVDAELLGKVKRFLKENTGWTSQFRGYNLFILSNLLCLEENYEELFSRITELYEKLRDEGLKNRAELPLTAYVIAKETDRAQWDFSIKRMIAFYQRMKENHFWLTSSDDYVYAAILAVIDMDVEKATDEIETCYTMLNDKGFHKGNNLQTLSHILAVGEESAFDKCNKTAWIFRGLKESGCCPVNYGLASVGVLALVAPDVQKVIEEVAEAYEYIYKKEGYGFWSIDKTTRAMLAASLVSDFYIDGIQKGILQVTLGNSIRAILIAQQQAAVAAACAASAASASAASAGT